MGSNFKQHRFLNWHSVSIVSILVTCIICALFICSGCKTYNLTTTDADINRVKDYLNGIYENTTFEYNNKHELYFGNLSGTNWATAINTKNDPNNAIGEEYSFKDSDGVEFKVHYIYEDKERNTAGGFSDNYLSARFNADINNQICSKIPEIKSVSIACDRGNNGEKVSLADILPKELTIFYSGTSVTTSYNIYERMSTELLKIITDKNITSKIKCIPKGDSPGDLVSDAGIFTIENKQLTQANWTDPEWIGISNTCIIYLQNKYSINIPLYPVEKLGTIERASKNDYGFKFIYFDADNQHHYITVKLDANNQPVSDNYLEAK